jgi:hypothetical protein
MANGSGEKSQMIGTRISPPDESSALRQHQITVQLKGQDLEVADGRLIVERPFVGHQNVARRVFSHRVR